MTPIQKAKEIWDAFCILNFGPPKSEAVIRAQTEKFKLWLNTPEAAALLSGEDWKEDGIGLIAAERERQKNVEGWTADHDRTHFYGELAKAAACYAVEHTDSEVVEHGENAWPWDDKWWKPSGDPIKNLVKAGALIAAEIDRIKPPKP